MNYTVVVPFLLAIASLVGSKSLAGEQISGLFKDNSNHSPLVGGGVDDGRTTSFIMPDGGKEKMAFIQPKNFGNRKVSIDDGGDQEGDGENGASNPGGLPPLDPSTEPPKRARFPQLGSTVGESRKKKEKTGGASSGGFGPNPKAKKRLPKGNNHTKPDSRHSNKKMGGVPIKHLNGRLRVVK